MQSSRYSYGACATLLALIGVTGSPAHAQGTSDKTPPPVEQQVSESASRDSIIVDAGIDISGGYVDNIFATRNYEVDDFIGIIAPRLELVANGKDYRIAITGRGEIGRYDSNASEDYSDWQLGLNSRAKLSPALTFVGGGEYRWDHENRASPDDVNGLEPTEFRRGYGFAGLLWDKGDYALRLAGTVTDLDFSDVEGALGTINNDDRDRVQYELGGRIGRKLSADTELFVQGAYDKRNYDAVFDDFGLDRNSDGYAAALGIRHRFSPRLSGEIFAGYMAQDYADPRLKNVRAMDFGAVLDWTDPEGISAAVKIDRSVEETTLPAASAYILTSGQLSLQAFNTARFNAGLNIGGSHYDYVGVDRSEFVTSAGIWGRYWLHKRIYLGADYDFAQRTSNRAGFDFDENRFFLRIGAQIKPRSNWDTASRFSFATGQGPAGLYGAVMFGHGTLVTGLDGPRGSDGSNTADFGDDGPAVIGAAGFGFVTGPVYLGVEAEGQLAGPEWSHDANRVFSVQKKDGLGASLRIGYVNAGSDILYGRFGIVSSHMRTLYDHPAGSEDISRKETGYAMGLGADAGFGRRGFVRAEYSLSSYGDYDVSTGEAESDNFSNTENQFRIGIGFRLSPIAKGTEDDASAHDFSGIYIGAQFGHGALISGNLGTRSGGTPVDISRSSSGPVLGLIAGAGITWKDFYFGAELGVDISNIDWNIERDPNGRIYSTEHEVSFGASARLGYQISKSALLFGRFGLDRTKFDTKYATTKNSVRERNWKTGTRYGGGLELGLDSSTRVRLEYDHSNYGRFDIAPGDAVDTFDSTENIFRMAVIFKL